MSAESLSLPPLSGHRELEAQLQEEFVSKMMRGPLYHAVRVRRLQLQLICCHPKGVDGTAGRPLVMACFGCSLPQREIVGLCKETTKRLTIGKSLQLSENVVCIKMPQNGKPGGGEHEVTGTPKPQLSQQLSSTGRQLTQGEMQEACVTSRRRCIERKNDGSY